MSSVDRLKVGFVGAGQMGMPMVVRLASAGYRPTVLARRPAVATAIEQAGGVAVSSLTELADCDVVLCCLFDASQQDEVVLGEGGLLGVLRPASAIVSHTTAPRAAVEAIASAAAAAGVGFLDAPVSGTAADIAAGRLTVLLGGVGEVAKRCEPLIASYSSTIRHTGGVGTATALKLLNNSLFAANIQLAATAVGLAEEQGIPLDVAMEALQHCSGDSRALGHMRLAGGPTLFAERVSHYLVKDVAAVREFATQAGVDLGVITKAIDEGPLSVA